MNPYQINLSDANLQGPFASLTVLYKGMPKTVGCEKCAEINGIDNRDWCCLKQSPSMYYVEFLYVLKHVQDNWSHKKRQELLLKAVRNYLDNSLSKGCIFYGNPGCSIHEYRPFACRMYSVIPQENWEKRWKILKTRQGDNFEALPQCTLVTAEKEISAAQEDKWFEYTKKCEERIGVPSERIALHDEAGGSYRTFHDHLLLEFLGEDIMQLLTNVRLTNPSKKDIDITVEKIRSLINQ